MSRTLQVLVFSSVFLATAALGTGCAATAEDQDTAADESEVQTASCPATIDLAFEKPTILARTPTRHPDGSPLSGTEVGRLADAMTDARALDGIEMSLALSNKNHGRCYYRGEGFERRATFRTKNGKNILDVQHGNLRMYLFPTAYSTERLTFENDRAITLFANVPASGPFSDGASSNIEIGSTKLKAKVDADHQFIAQMATDIGEYFRYETSAYANNVARLAPEALPEIIRARAQARLAEERQGLAPRGSADLGEDAYAIVKDGRTIGYVIAIDHAIDDPLWDGSGVHVYVDLQGNVVMEIPWTG